MHIILKTGHAWLLYFTKLHFTIHFVVRTQVSIMNSQVENKALRFIESSQGKGHKLLVCDSYEFQANLTKKNATYFYCDHRRMGCDAKITLYDFSREQCTFSSYKVTKEKHNNHQPIPENIKNQESLTAAKNIVPENDVSSRFMDLRTFYGHNSKIKVTMTYFYDNYIGYS
jgi:hypothetical protein